jgi:hypothetical protein
MYVARVLILSLLLCFEGVAHACQGFVAICRCAAAAIRSAFCQHPYAGGETYMQHMKAALHIAALMTMGAGAACLHAVFPMICQTTASSQARYVCAFMDARRARALQLTT